MFQFDINSFAQNFRPSLHTTWIPIAKIGLGFILAGLLIMALKDLIIALLSLAAISVGVYLLIVAFRIYRMNRMI